MTKLERLQQEYGKNLRTIKGHGLCLVSNDGTEAVSVDQIHTTYDATGFINGMADREMFSLFSYSAAEWYYRPEGSFKIRGAK